MAVYQTVAELVARANAMHFRFDLSGLGEMIQIARYDADDDGRYDWHQDIGATISRKLSVTVQLTNPTNYDGGDLEIYKSGNEALKASRARGAVTIFPSYQLHRVAPVTRGTRCSLVCWVSGNPFR
jgi:PKHD-type hydroxylase